MVEELESSGVDTSFCMSAKDGASHFNYVIVDNQTWVHCLLLCCVSMV
jgi:hypothetical protein